MRTRVVLLCLLSMLLIAPAARADEVTDQINEALTAYRKNDRSTTLTALEAAASLLRQARADAFKALLPKPLPGWTAEAAEANVLSAVIMGGGITVSRKYRKGDEHLDVEIIADSPIAQSMGAMINSPITAMGGGVRHLVIGGQRLAYIKDENAYMAMVQDKILVKVSASSAVPDEALRGYVTALDFAAIEKLKN